LNKKRHWKVNKEIRPVELRVIDSEGKMMGLMSRDEAIAIAEKSGIDLVEIAPNANPPVAKIIEIGKFLYIE